MNEEIESIFNGILKIDNKEIPIEFEDYKGNSEEYIVYFDDGNIPIFSSDDEILYSEDSIEFNIYTKGNYLNIVKELKKILKRHDYSWNGDEGDAYEADTKYHHFILSFKKIREVD